MTLTGRIFASLRVVIGAMVIVLGMSFLTGCGFTGEPEAGNVLRMNNMAEPAHLDPALQTSVEDQRITLALFEGLCSYDPKTLAPIPGVAERWDRSADGRIYTFHLRRCTWSDGRPVRADDFLYAWRRVLTPPTDKPERRDPSLTRLVVSPYADLLYLIEGAEAFHIGTTDDFSEVGIEVVNDVTLRVTLARATPWFLELTCFPTWMPVPTHVVETHGRDWTRVENIVTNGPFALADRRLGDSLHVVRREDYWDAGGVQLDAVVYFSTDHVDTAIDQFLAGETDWVRRFNPLKVRAWRADAELSTYLTAPEYIGTYFYRFNVRKPPFDDARVRRAFAHAVDRASITRHVTGLGETSAEGIVPPCVSTVRPWKRLEGRGCGFDPPQARTLLAEAGYPKGEGFPIVTLAFNTDVKNKAIAEAAQSMWREHLGVDVRLENREKRVHLAEERAGRYQISRGSWIGDFNDPTTFLDFMVSTRSNNRTGWKNDEFDRLVTASLDQLDEDRRLAMLERAETVLMQEDAPLLALYYYRSEQVLRPGAFEGIYDNARDLHPPKFIRRIEGDF